MHAERKLLARSAEPGVNAHCSLLPGTQAERQHQVVSEVGRERLHEQHQRKLVRAYEHGHEWGARGSNPEPTD